MRVSPLIVAVVSLALAVPVSAQEALKLSRYRIRLEVGGGGGQAEQVFGGPEFEERCRDDDGCEISLVLTGATYNAVQGRIFFNANGTAWVGQNGQIGHNANGTEDTVITLNNGPTMTCGLHDGDTFLPVDSGNDVTLELYSPVTGGVQCIMTLID